MRPEETRSLTVTLSNEQRIEVPEAVVRRLRGWYKGAFHEHPTPGCQTTSLL